MQFGGGSSGVLMRTTGHDQVAPLRCCSNYVELIGDQGRNGGRGSLFAWGSHFDSDGNGVETKLLSLLHEIRWNA